MVNDEKPVNIWNDIKIRKDIILKKKGNFKYLVNSDQDISWGLAVDNIGESLIKPKYDVYPPKVGHPDNYYFDITKGRTLDNYQLIYISKGRGTYHCSDQERIEIEEGEMIIIPPYTWHSYYPDPKTGWHEYWIGIRGEDVDSRFRSGFFNPEEIQYKVGIQDEIIGLYKSAIEIAMGEQPGYQQLLAGIANNMLAMVLYFNQNKQLDNNIIAYKIDKARNIMRENILSNLTPQEVAGQVDMSYSQFRSAFKKYTNISPAHYALELKLQQARTLLLNSQMNIKEIAQDLKYKDASCFSALFKKYTGISPTEYRAQIGKR